MDLLTLSYNVVVIDSLDDIVMKSLGNSLIKFAERKIWYETEVTLAS